MTAQRQGLAFSQEHCSACHAIDTGISPKPEAPSFEAIINTPGLTARTLNPWLRNSHNFPEIMNFEIARSEEHTSELQSLMRISYAVFCLKKKKQSSCTPTDMHQIRKRAINRRTSSTN